MKLMDISEKYVMSVRKSNSLVPVFKNPTQEELRKIMQNGVIKCIITKDNVYAFDYTKVSYSDVSTMKGLKAIIFFKKQKNISIELPRFDDNVEADEAEETIKNNQYLKTFTINDIIHHNETD